MKKYGLIGYPLTHSFSKRFFTEKFEKDNVAASYENFEIVEISRFPEVIANNPALIGLNVTIPYKEQVIPFLDELDGAAQEVGAVNTVKITREGEKTYLKGFNTDTWGFETSLASLLKDYHKKALILGTGGASKAIKYVLKKRGIEFISASIEELQENEIRYEEIDEKMMAERLLIINATPLGTYPKVETFPPIPYEYITGKHLMFDLVYNPELTKFMEKGKAQGAAVKNGYEMLLQQALKSYEIWNV
ncbi:shikimate dehydrogenase [Mariniphaga sediminis]|uniref:Shikimate dehydrogenase n=1 Tax=Mariniphaga sediminis TaxID=1628158 RepID=A0A399D1R4_9BACT|nr:shikimate dehydrogenase [Mariniphaga sediminis]RIH65393.1 shikimate dehydrogenase [Mariniphaga sediminis]